MALLNDPKYMIYTRGYDPTELCLGHLIFGPRYKDPIDQASYVCRFPQLEPAELQKWTTSTAWSGGSTSVKGGKMNPLLEVADIGELGVGADWKHAKILRANKGRRIELRDPRKFLAEKVLPNIEPAETLKLWLSASRSKYVLSDFPHFKPRIWMLTGLYELEDVQVSASVESHLSLNLGVSSAIIGSTTGVPIGGAIEFGKDSTTQSNGNIPGPLVFAARYQLLQVTYEKVKAAVSLLNVKLHPDNIFSRGSMLGDGDSELDILSKAEFAELDLNNESPTSELSRPEQGANEGVSKKLTTAQRRMKDRSMLST